MGGERSARMTPAEPVASEQTRAPAETAEGPEREPAATGSALRLQRRAGNRAAVAVLEQAAPPPVLVGAANDPAEAAADRLAERALARLAPPAPPGAGGGHESLHRATSSSSPLAGAFEADGEVASALTARLGKGSQLPSGVRRSMESGFGADFGGVRVHADAHAARLADSLGAEAFTHGRDIFFGARRFQPEGADGQALLAHELAHVVQGGQGAHRAVRRKLKGTRAAVTDMAGKASLGQKIKQSDYAKILSKLDDYESRETKVVAKKAFGKGDREWMTKTLNDIIKLIDGWTTRHETEEKKKAHGEMHWRTTQDTYQNAKAEKDFQGMAAAEDKAQGTVERKQISALRMLRPRVALERQELMDPAYFKTSVLSDPQMKKGGDWNKDNAVGGAMNRLDKVEYGGGKKGFFIKDKANAAEGADVAEGSGIDKFDPNQGARSVASSRLAKLFGAKEITSVEFATHQTATRYKEHSDAKPTRKMGVFSEKAEGEEAYDHKLARNDQERAEYSKPGQKVIDMNDPELQRGLNVLQMLDYISRQLDRHMHNVYIATDDKGKVLGVTGIDLDLSFGARGNNGGDLKSSGHFVGIPQLADAEFRAKVLSVKPEEVRACLDGLLSEAEVAASVERFVHLRKVLAEMDPKKVVKAGGWGADTAKQQSDGGSSYLGKLKETTLYAVYDDSADKALAGLTSAGLNPERRKVGDAVKELVYSGKLSPGQGLGLLDALVSEITTNSTLQWKREMKAGSTADERKASKTVEMLSKVKTSITEAGGADQDTKMARIEAQIMAAQVEKEAVSVIKKAVDEDYDAAVAMVIKTLSDFAVHFASRQKRAMTPTRRPARV